MNDDYTVEDFVIIKTEDDFILPPALLSLLKKSIMRCITIYVTTNLEQIMKFIEKFETADATADHLMPVLAQFGDEFIKMAMQNGSTELNSDTFEEAVLEFMDEHIRKEVTKAG